jgi:cyanophycin synthetase
LRQTWAPWFEKRPAQPPDPLLAVAETAAFWALAALNEVRGFLHDAGAVHLKQGVRAWLGFHHASLTHQALELALQTLAGAAREEPDWQDKAQASLARLWTICRGRHPDYQARILMQGALALDVPVLPFLPTTKHWQYGWGKRSRHLVESSSDQDGVLGGRLSGSKVASKAVFDAHGLPSPSHRLVEQPAQLLAAAEAVGWPCVLKPVEGGGGKGVTANIRTPEQLQAAFEHARSFKPGPFMVETFVPGDDHRLMVIDGKLHAAIRREPSFVTGDGLAAIAQLVGRINASRSTNMVVSRYLRPIALDQVLQQHLASQGMSLATVLAPGQRVSLRSNANLSTGGICTDVTERVHPQVRLMAEMAASAFGLACTGVDYICTDISLAPAACGGQLIEINTCPSLDVMIAAGADPVAVASAVLGPVPGRIASMLVVLPHEALAAARDLLSSMPWPGHAGLACSDWAVVAGLPLVGAKSQAWAAVQQMLRHARLQAFIVGCSDRELMSMGMPVDRVDRVVTIDVRLPNEWLKTLERYAGRVQEAPAANLEALCHGFFAHAPALDGAGP